MLRTSHIAMILVLFVLMSAAASAAEKAPETPSAKIPGQPAPPQPSKPPPPKAKTLTVDPEPLRIDIVLKGVFEAKRMTEVSRDPKAWKPMMVLWAADAGVTVRKGDVLVKLDTEDLDQAIKDLEAGRALSDLAWKQAGEELRLLDKDVQEQLAHAERIKQRTDEDFRYYRKGQAPFRPKYLVLHKKRADFWLEFAQTELRELKRMYEADDLVESTEGLVLKRQQLRLDWEKLDHEKSVKFAIPRVREVEIPRTKEDQEKTVRDAAAALDRARTTLPLLLRQKKLEIEKMKYDRAKAAEHLTKLKADRETMIVRAPAGGVVYYGQCVRGRWTSVDKAAAQLRKGGQLGPHQVFITIVDTRQMFVRAAAAEQHLRDLRKGMDAQVTPTGYPDGKIKGEVDSVTIQPGGPEKYTIRVSAPRRRGPLPGMTCTVRLVAYERKRAITVPAAAVFAEPGDPDGRYVYLKPADGKKPAKRSVTVGRTKNGQLEIRKGLAKGDVILLQKPAK